MDRDLQIVLQARDEASGVIQKVGKAAGTAGDFLKDSFGKAAIVSGVALAGLTAEAFKAVGAFAEAEAAQRQLEHAVLDVSHATKEQLTMTEALANQLEAKGVLDGDNIKIGLAQLSTFGLTNDAVRGLGKSLADLAVNQFGVNASGDQLSQTANMIAKALNGQFGVLEKSGIRFTEAQQHIIQFGTEMEKVKAINEGFAQNLKYTNDVASTTTEGGIARMNVAIGNLEESFGGFIAHAIAPVIPALTAFANILNSISQYGLTEMDQIQGDLTDNMGVFGTVLGNILLFLSQHQEAVVALAGAIAGFLSIAIIGATAAMIGFLGVSAPVILGFMAIGAAVALVITYWSQIVPVLTPVMAFFQQVFGIISANVMEFVTAIAPVFSEAWNNIVTAIQVGLVLLGALWVATWPSMQMIFIGAWNIIKGAFEVIWGLIQLSIAVGLGLITGDWTKAWNGIKVAFKDVWQGIKDIFTGVWDFILAGFRNNINSIIGMLNGFISQINKFGGKGNGGGLPTIPSFDNGGWVPFTGPAIVHGGEFVLSNDMLQGKQSVPDQISEVFNQPINVNIYGGNGVDGNVIGYQVAWALRNSR